MDSRQTVSQEPWPREEQLEDLRAALATVIRDLDPLALQRTAAIALAYMDGFGAPSLDALADALVRMEAGRPRKGPTTDPGDRHAERDAWLAWWSENQAREIDRARAWLDKAIPSEPVALALADGGADRRVVWTVYQPGCVVAVGASRSEALDRALSAWIEGFVGDAGLVPRDLIQHLDGSPIRFVRIEVSGTATGRELLEDVLDGWSDGHRALVSAALDVFDTGDTGS